MERPLRLDRLRLWRLGLIGFRDVLSITPEEDADFPPELDPLLMEQLGPLQLQTSEGDPIGSEARHAKFARMGSSKAPETGLR